MDIRIIPPVPLQVVFSMNKSNAQLEFEILTVASEFCRILDKSNDYFLLSSLASSIARRRYFKELYEENLPKSSLILKELWKLEVFKEIRKVIGK